MDFQASGESVEVGSGDSVSVGPSVGERAGTGVGFVEAVAAIGVLVAGVETSDILPHAGVSQATNAAKDNNNKTERRFIRGMSVLR